ncbi:MAG: prepilin-type N-terminal cleavage/methylation domain-containing protein [Planctomycetota bacterium]|nr:prepilin-type N-terminal cleavage/methylation domain-containing protein [Planctomycetota bacterium]
MTLKTVKNQGFTLVELLVVIAIIAGLVVPTLMNAQSKAHKLTCMANLRGLQNAAFIYSQKNNRFPIAKGMKEPPAHESLNVLLRHSSGEDLEPGNFVCPEGEAFEALGDDSEGVGAGFVLDEDTLSYTWPLKLTRPTKKGYLSCDKYVGDYPYPDGVEHEGHVNSMLIVNNSGKVSEIDTSDAEDLRKFRVDNEELLPQNLTR